MADENIIVTDPVVEPTEPQTPSVEDLMQQLAEANANATKWKNASDKQSSEIANMKKQIRSMQTEEQQKAEDEKAYLKDLEDYKLKNEAKNRYLGQGMDMELASKCADAEVGKDMDLLATLQKQYTDSVIKLKEEEWNRNRPQPNFGTGNSDTITKEQFNKMGYQERVELYNSNQELYMNLASGK